jgi:hypothetical protein
MPLPTSSTPRSRAFTLRYLLCVPSHIGALFVALQPQKKTFLDSVASNLSGVNSVPAWEPSHNGCLALFPQVHQKYDLPLSTSTPNGVSAALMGALTSFPSVSGIPALA